MPNVSSVAIYPSTSLSLTLWCLANDPLHSIHTPSLQALLFRKQTNKLPCEKSEGHMQKKCFFCRRDTAAGPNALKKMANSRGKLGEGGMDSGQCNKCVPHTKLGTQLKSGGLKQSGMPLQADTQ